jgi:hypothetical protein
MGRTRHAIALACAGIVLATAACTAEATDDTAPGRACEILGLDLVARELGVRFDRADGAQVEQTDSCVLSMKDRAFPDLTFTMSPTGIDELIFRASATPNGATTIEELGRQAYQVNLSPTRGPDGKESGPRLQVGWLSSTPNMMMLRMTWNPGDSGDQVLPQSARLPMLARSLEAAVAAG